MTKHFSFSKVFFKFFSTHFTILIIPLAITGFISGNIIHGIMKEQVTRDGLDTIIQYSNRIDSELQKISEIAFKSSNELEFSPHIISDFNNNARSIMGKLRSYKTSNDFIHDIYLVSDFSDYVFSPNTTYTTKRFVDQKVDGIISRQELFSQLKSAKSSGLNSNLLSPQQKNNNNFYLISTLPNSGNSFYAFLIFEVSAETITKISDSFVASSDKYFIIINNDSVLSSSSKTEEPFKYEVLQQSRQLASENKSGYFSLDIKSKYYDTYYSRIMSTGWLCIFTISKESGYMAISKVINTFILTQLILLCIGIILTFIVACINYFPIKTLARLAQKLNHSTDGDKIKNEINYIGNIITKTCESMEEFYSEQKQSLVARQYYLLKDIMNGVPFEQSQIKTMLENHCIHMYDSNYFVAIMRVHANKNTINLFEIANSINQYEIKDTKIFAVNLYDDRLVALCSSKDYNLANIKIELQRCIDHINQQFHVNITIGMGGIKSGLVNIYTSFVEATTALDYRFILGKNIVIVFYDLKINPFSDINYPKSFVNELCTAIKNGQEKRTGQVLHSLFYYIKDNSNSLQIAKFLCYDVINSVIKTLQEIRKDTNIDEVNPNLLSVSTFETIKDLEAMIVSFCHKACNYVNSTQEITLSDMAVTFINNNLTNPSFSVSIIANHLDISVSHLSRTFKEQKGITLNEYIKNIKIDAAKKLLVETDYPLEKVINSLGYYDSSSFIKKFKSTVGITPGEYRKLYKNL